MFTDCARHGRAVFAAPATDLSGSAATGFAQYTDPAGVPDGLFSDEHSIGPWTLVETRFGWISWFGQTGAAMPDDNWVDPPPLL
ncbi:MAG: hypothetical protein WCF90_02655 [Methanomicrobiales archaeon]